MVTKSDYMTRSDRSYDLLVSVYRVFECAGSISRIRAWKNVVLSRYGVSTVLKK